jgi:hypothetical protein
MDLNLVFKNFETISVKPEDEVYFLASRYNEVIYVKRADNSVGALYSTKTGKLILHENEFDDAYIQYGKSFDFKVIPYLFVVKDGKTGVYSLAGELIVPIEFKSVDSSFMVHSFIVQGFDNLYGTYSNTGEMLVPATHKEFHYVTSYRGIRFLCSKDKKSTCVITQHGNLVVETDKKVRICQGFVIVVDSDKYETYNHKGKMGEFTGKYTQLREGYLELTQGKKKGVIYIDGSFIVPMGDYIQIRKHGNLLIALKSDGEKECFTIPEEDDKNE